MKQWKAEGLRVYTADGIEVALITRDANIDDYKAQRAEAEARAALIASAPELLQSVWDLLRLAQSRVAGDPAISRALDVIAKAEGRGHE